MLAMVFRSLLFEPFHIPSGSMLSTLQIGDYIFVSKYSYGYSQYSFPFSPPIIEGRIAKRTPERGDVAVFRLPTDDRAINTRLLMVPIGTS
ncbi:MAG: signal peptidase I, partial [Rickettsiales bacterium]|nr:signal peptidase I [Rickettsiales bacterium]